MQGSTRLSVSIISRTEMRLSSHLHSVTFLFSNARCREVPTNRVIKLLFECSLANSTSPFGIVRNCKGSYSQLKIRFFEKQFHYSDNPKDFHSPEGLLGIKSTTKKPIWIILTKYPKNGEPGIFKKVPRDKKNFPWNSSKYEKIFLFYEIFHCDPV